ncbi:uncharacterized protein LOC129903695 [Solanum dulcamara]|uniref:uncharacterized protein LOC129903695 n=1 Tax=Solanum dulcamara TaxID=45834 RepID=UPI002485DFE2|nr:uncharacterized protein LOC129903695 [Solanum dulcamara]
MGKDQTPNISITNNSIHSQTLNNKATLSLNKKKRDAINKKLIQERQSEQTSENYVLIPEQAVIQMQSAEQSKLSQKTISDGFEEEYTVTDHDTPLQIYDVSNERQELSKEDNTENLSDEYRVTHSEDEEDPDQWEDEQQENQLETFRSNMAALLQKETQQEKEKKEPPSKSKQERKRSKQSLISRSDNVAVKSNINTRSKSYKL